jgi:sulfur dioxygenase
MVLFRQLFDPQSSTYTYMLACSKEREAVIIDPVFELARRDSALIEELGLNLVATLETHIHADHVTGGWLLRERFGSAFMVAKAGGAEGADRYLKHDDHVRFGGCHLVVRATLGHTASCLTFVLQDRSMAFTGDSLLIRGCGRTDFQGGSAEELYRSVHDQIFSLPDDCLLYPGHDYRGLTVSSVAEERRFNPRLGGELSAGDFCGFMNNLGLPHPKQMDIAVPANLRCGRPDACSLPNEEPDWAPLNLTFAGIWEAPPLWVEENLNKVQILDVRQPEEFVGPLGHIPGAILIPLDTLNERAGELDKEKPVIAVCRAGGRSAQATNILRKQGFGKVANLPGGMLRWRSLNLTTEAASQDA